MYLAIDLRCTTARVAFAIVAVVLAATVAATQQLPPRPFTSASNGAEQTEVPFCPGLDGGRCTTACQLAICHGLASFFAATFNASNPWINTVGWRELTSPGGCEKLVRPASAGVSTDGWLSPRPAYCDFHGVTCCNLEGVLTQSCAGVHSVRSIDLQVNGLNGFLDDSRFMSGLAELHACGVTKLQLQGNELAGSLASPVWGNLTGLTYLDLSSNNLEGTIPEALRNLRQLTRLSLGTNNLHGPVPEWIGKLSELETLNLGQNTGNNPSPWHSQGLVGSLPASLAQLHQLNVLNLELNSLTGELPAGLCYPGAPLRALKLRGNILRGKMAQLTNCSELSQLDISANDFGGPLWMGPSSASAGSVWSQLAVLDASGNQFTGTIPPALYELPVLEYLNLAGNRLSGQIPRHITLSLYLRELNLEHNALSGPLDEALWLLPHLRLLDVSHNTLTGSLPEAVGRAFNLEELTLSYNNLSGPVPPQLGQLKKLQAINLAGNPRLNCAAVLKPTRANTSSGAVQLRCDAGARLPCFLTLSNYTAPRSDGSNMACPAPVRRRLADAERSCVRELGAAALGLADTLPEEQGWKLDPSYSQYAGCSCLTGFEPSWSSNNTVLTCVPAAPIPGPSWAVALIVATCVSGAMLLCAVGLLVWLRMTVQLRPRWQREKELAEARRRGMPAGGPATIVVTDIEGYSELMAANAPLAAKALGIHNSLLRRAASVHAGSVVEQEGDSWSVAFHSPLEAVAFCLQVQQALARTNWARALGARPPWSTQGSAKLPVAETEGMPLLLQPGTPGAANRSICAAAPTNWEGHAATAQPATRPCAVNNTAVDNDGDSTVLTQQGRVARWLLLGRRGRKPAKSRRGYATWVREAERQTRTHNDGTSSPSAGRLLDSPFAGLAAAGGSVTSAGNGVDNGGGGVQHSAGSTLSGCSASSRSIANLERSVLPGGRGCGGLDSSVGDECVAAGSVVCCDAPSFSGIDMLPSVGPLWEGSPGAGVDGQVRYNSGGGSSRSARFWAALGLGSPRDRLTPCSGTGDCVAGLRVRMGVATGCVPAHTDVTHCALLELAKAVSDMAHGGQILLEAGCFGGVRDRLTELGGVDHRGYNDITLAQAARAAMRQHTSGVLAFARGLLCWCLGGGWQGEPASATPDCDAVLLDLGELYVPGLAAVLPAISSGSRAASSDGGWQRWLQQQQQGSVLPQHVGTSCVGLQAILGAITSWGADAGCSPTSQPPSAALAAVAAALFTPPCSARSSSEPSIGPVMLQLYSIAPRALSGRAVSWGCIVAAGPGAQRTSGGFWDAPGVESIPMPPNPAVLYGDRAGIPHPMLPLPRVTMVFAALDGGRGRGARRHEAARIVHATLIRLMQAVLLALPDRDGRRDGYLCRSQEGELRYMLAFREPARALEWCLVMQDVLCHIPWPQHVLEAFEGSSAPVVTSASPTAIAAAMATQHPRPCSVPVDTSRPQSPVSCSGGGSVQGSARPRLNMGVAEGQPHCIMPDHLGRADYHGTSVNLAARMLAVAAAGGSIVTSCELAQAVFSTWAYESELMRCQAQQAPEKQQEQQQQQQQQQLEQQAQHVPQHTEGHVSTGSCQPSPANGPPSIGSDSQSGSVMQQPVPPVWALGALHSSNKSGRDCPRRAGPVLVPARYPACRVIVSGWHIGAYSFKGCGAVDMVTFTACRNGDADALSSGGGGVRGHVGGAACTSSGDQGNTAAMAALDAHAAAAATAAAAAAAARGGKGCLLAPRTGPVVGMQGAPVLLPDILPLLRLAWRTAAAVASAAEHSRILAGQLARPNGIPTKSPRVSWGGCTGGGAAGGPTSMGMKYPYAPFQEPPDMTRTGAGTPTTAAWPVMPLVLLPRMAERTSSGPEHGSSSCEAGSSNGAGADDAV